MESFGVINYFSYFIGCALIVLLPGPNSMYVISLAAQQGVRNGWAAACGIFLGDAILMLATALGAVSLLTTYPELFAVIKYVGAVYLGYLGLRMLQSAWVTWGNKQLPEPNEAATLRQTTGSRAFKKALLIGVLNPKAIFFLLSFFVQFVDPNYPYPAVAFLVLAMTLQVCSFVYLGTLIYMGNRLAENFKKRRRLSALSGGAVGALFLGFAAKLAFATI